MPSADEIMGALGLAPHPEGGWYRETFRAAAPEGKRAAVTAIYYLLKAGERSHWHRVDAAEIWHWYAGAPLELEISGDGKSRELVRLGIDFGAGKRAQPGRLDLGGMHGFARVRIRGLRTGAAGLATRRLIPAPNTCAGRHSRRRSSP